MQVLDLCEPPAPADSAVSAPAVPAEHMVPDPLPERETAVSAASSFWRRSTGRLVMMALIVLGVRIFIGEASLVPTASMEGTILVGDHLFMDKFLYGPEIPLLNWRLPMLKKISRGDIVVFPIPKGHDRGLSQASGCCGR